MDGQNDSGSDDIRKVICSEGAFIERRNSTTGEVIERLYALKRFDEVAKQELDSLSITLGWDIVDKVWQDERKASNEGA